MVGGGRSSTVDGFGFVFNKRVEAGNRNAGFPAAAAVWNSEFLDIGSFHYNFGVDKFNKLKYHRADAGFQTAGK
jgi:hypothetical protein